MKSIKLIVVFIILLSSNSFCSAAQYVKFDYIVYKNTTCSGKTIGRENYDTSKKCINYSYVDSKGVTFKGSMGNFRCYKDKVVADKYPFAENCNAAKSVYEGKQTVEMNANIVIAPACQIAPSHEGSVSEHITHYTYPGNENCAIKK